MNGQELDMVINQPSGTFMSISIVPIIGIIVTVLLFYFAYKFYRNESKMSFIEKIKFLKRVVKIVLVLFVSVIAIVMFIMLFVILSSMSFGFAGPVIILLLVALAMSGAMLYLYYLIYKEYKVLINNFEQEKIFEDENAVALKNIARVSMWLLFATLAMSLVGYLAASLLTYVISNVTGLANAAKNININGALNANTLIHFIICIVLYILAAVFEKSVEIYKENKSIASHKEPEEQ